MIRLTQIKLPADHTPEMLTKKAAKLLRISPEEIRELHIRKRSLDARKKPELFYSYTVDVSVKREAELIHKLKNPQISLCKEVRYRFPESGETVLKERPLIIGTGPAGLFCGLLLARLPPCFAGTRKRSGRATEKGERVLAGRRAGYADQCTVWRGRRRHIF